MNADALAKLKDIAGPKGFSEDPKEIAPYLEEWRSQYHGRSGLLLKPANTGEVSAILKVCYEYGLPLVPQGGNTGLVGGQIAYDGEIVLSTARLNKIRTIDAQGKTLVAEAGVPLAFIQQAAAEQHMLFPLSLASEGSCTIGGNLSTNAGGVGVLRYGMTRDLVLGIEVVLADGRLLNLLRTLRKDNTGYDLKQLFIGAEGTLGIITAVALKLFPAPSETATALVAIRDVPAALELLGSLQAATGGLMSAFELIPRIGMDLVLAHIPGTMDPLASPSPWYVLAEAASGPGIRQMLEDGLSGTLESGAAVDAVLAKSETQRKALWQLRETISEAQKREGASIKHDVSVPVVSVPDFISRASEAVLALVPGARAVTFGHIGDGNLHFNFQAPKAGDAHAFLDRWSEVQAKVHEIVHDFGGSISAEHGIGVQKREALVQFKSPEEIAVMRSLKAMFDPKGIMNPGKILV